MNGYGNSIFHDMVAENEYTELLKWSKNRNFEDLVITSTNNDGENLLHLACRLKKSDVIHSMVSRGYSIIAQDINGNTPLHVAIIYESSECVDKFQKLFEHMINCPHSIEKFQKLFKMYDSRGRTVLHLAVLYNLENLVDVMLKCYESMEIDVFEYEVLGNGYNILHLAKTAKLGNMVNLIMKRLPNACDYTDYAGYDGNGNFIQE